MSPYLSPTVSTPLSLAHPLPGTMPPILRLRTASLSAASVVEDESRAVAPPLPLDGFPHTATPRALPPSPLPLQLQLHSDSLAHSSHPDLLVHPASPALPSPASSFETAQSSPSSEADSPGGSASLLVLPTTSLAARRKNKKQLSLVVPTSSVPASLASPLSPALLHPGGSSNAETRSLPPSPVSLAAYIGVEGSEQEDRTIGRLMLRQQADEMREQMKGGRSMKRRTSIPRLNLAGSTHKPAPLNLGSTNGGSAVRLIRRDAVENRGFGADSERADGMDVDEVPEEFPYALGPREIIPGVWLGSEANARDPQVIRDGGFKWVLNVAKEVECPWVGEVISEDDEDDEARKSSLESTRESSADETWPGAPPPVAKPKHRRTKTQAAIQPPSIKNPRALFVRPTASTPNLQSAFNAVAPPPLPPLPSLSRPKERRNSEGEGDLSPTTERSLHSSPSQKRRSPPRPRPPPTTTIASETATAAPIASGSAPLVFPEHRRSGRPALEYLWLKWGHDESDLVEAGKLQAGFDFLDRARASEGGKGKVLVHCQCGVSRSATIVIAYCMREAARALEEGHEDSELAGVTGMHDAYSFVKEKSEWVGPNLCLVFQLVAYERTLRGAPPDLEDEEPPFPDYSNATADSPRTPLSSEGSSDSQLSTPETGEASLSSSFSVKGSSPPLTIATGRQDLKLRVQGEGEDEVLSPMAQALSISTHDVGADDAAKTSEAAPSGVFILPTPPRRLLDISPLPAHVTMAPTTPFIEIDSPAPSRLTFSDQAARTAHRWGFPAPPKATLLNQTPTAAAFAAPKLPSAAQLSLSRGLPPSPPSDGDPRKVFGGSQTPSQRRASHRRVFSWSSAKDVPTPPS